MQPQTGNSAEPPYLTRSPGPVSAELLEDSQLRALRRAAVSRSQGGSSILSGQLEEESESRLSVPQKGQSGPPAFWAYSSFGWEDSWEMEDSGLTAAKPGGSRFDGKAAGLSITDLKLWYQNKLQLLWMEVARPGTCWDSPASASCPELYIASEARAHLTWVTSRNITQHLDFDNSHSPQRHK